MDENSYLKENTKSDNELLSIIVPAYNAEKYLNRCIDSILSQSLQRFELIIIDDGSKDSTAKICDDYKKKDSRIRIIHQENKGASASREIGVKNAIGCKIGFVDADDYLETNYFEKLLEIMGDAECVVCGVIKENGEGEKNRILNNIKAGTYQTDTDRYEIYSKMLCSTVPFEFGILPYVWNKIFIRAELLSILQKVDKHIFDGEDVSIVFPYLLGAKKIIVSDFCGYHYVIRKDSISNKKRKTDYYNEACLYQWLYENFSQSKFSEILIEQLNRYMLMMMWKRKPDIYVEANKFVFPSDLVPYGTNIIIYGDGDMGRCFIKQIEQNKHCNIIACADIKHEAIKIENNIRYIPPRQIVKEKFDYVLIAINDHKLVEMVRDNLVKNGVESNKIKCL